jgi:hypothetical protein
LTLLSHLDCRAAPATASRTGLIITDWGRSGCRGHNSIAVWTHDARRDHNGRRYDHGRYVTIRRAIGNAGAPGVAVKAEPAKSRASV